MSISTFMLFWLFTAVCGWICIYRNPVILDGMRAQPKVALGAAVGSIITNIGLYLVVEVWLEWSVVMWAMCVIGSVIGVAQIFVLERARPYMKRPIVG